MCDAGGCVLSRFTDIQDTQWVNTCIGWVRRCRLHGGLQLLNQILRDDEDPETDQDLWRQRSLRYEATQRDTDYAFDKTVHLVYAPFG